MGKRIGITACIAIALLILVLVGAENIQPLGATPLGIVPTSIPDVGAGPGQGLSIADGGIVRNGMAIAGTADESQLVIVANSTQTAATPVVQVQSWDGVEVLGVYAGGYGVSAGGVKAVAPTAQPTNVPGLVVNNASSRANSLEVRVASTPQFTIGPSGYAKVPIDLPHIGLPAVETTAITYTVAAGGTGNVWTCPGKCLVHSVLANVTTNFDTTGDDTTLTIGDATDGDGYLTLADAELQAADTEGTGFAAGWQGTSASTLGAYLDLNHNSFPVVGTSAVPYTMTYTLDETSGETLTAGAATFYVTYTRLD